MYTHVICVCEALWGGELQESHRAQSFLSVVIVYGETCLAYANLSSPVQFHVSALGRGGGGRFIFPGFG